MKMTKRSRIILFILRYTIMIVTLGYVVFQFLVFPLLAKFLPRAYDLCPFAIQDSFNEYLMQNQNALPFYFTGVIALFLLGLVLTVLFRRVFCGNICPLGTVQEMFGNAGKWFFVKVLKRDRPEIPRNIDIPMRYIKYVAMGTGFLIAWYFGDLLVNITLGNLLDKSSLEMLRPFEIFNPWITVEYIRFPSQIFGLHIIAFITMIITLIGSFVYERFFCKYLCPAGAMYAIISKASFTKIAVSDSAEHQPDSCEPETCQSCSLSSRNCPVNIPLDIEHSINSPECITCFKCVSDKRNDKFRVKFLGKPVNAVIILCLGALIFFGSIVTLRHLGILDQQLPHPQTIQEFSESIGYPVDKFLAAYNIQDKFTGNDLYTDMDNYILSLPVKEYIKLISTQKDDKFVDSEVNKFLTEFKLKGFAPSKPLKEALGSASILDIAQKWFDTDVATFKKQFNIPDQYTSESKYGEVIGYVEKAQQSQYIDSEYLPCCLNEDFYRTRPE